MAPRPVAARPPARGRGRPGASSPSTSARAAPRSRPGLTPGGKVMRAPLYVFCGESLRTHRSYRGGVMTASASAASRAEAAGQVQEAVGDQLRRLAANAKVIPPSPCTLPWWLSTQHIHGRRQSGLLTSAANAAMPATSGGGGGIARGWCHLAAGGRDLRVTQGPLSTSRLHSWFSVQSMLSGVWMTPRP
jgi:hypothetical protein